VELDSITFPFCRDLVDEWIKVSEDEIARSMRQTIEEEHLLIEGAAAVAVAVAAGKRAALAGPVAVVLCGANVSADRIRSIL
jgi:threonine dehydratase